jgi:hypothetical protein
MGWHYGSSRNLYLSIRHTDFIRAHNSDSDDLLLWHIYRDWRRYVGADSLIGARSGVNRSGGQGMHFRSLRASQTRA